MTDALTRCCEELIRMGEKLHAVTAERNEAIEALRRVVRYALPITRHDVEDEKHARAILAKHAKGDQP